MQKSTIQRLVFALHLSFVLLAFTVCLALTGCGGGNSAAPSVNPFAGSYSGTYGGTQGSQSNKSGTFTLNVANDGTAVATLSNPTGAGPVIVGGTVSSAGVIAIQGTANGLTGSASGTLTQGASGVTGSGTYQLSDGNIGYFGFPHVIFSR